MQTELPPQKPEVDVYAQQLCDRFDVAKLQATEKKFYPHKSLNKTSIKEIIKDKEPVISSIHSTNSPSMAKMLTLQESIEIQQDQTKKLKVNRHQQLMLPSFSLLLSSFSFYRFLLSTISY